VKGSRAWVLGALPGALLLAAASAGWAPTARDLPTYFVPLRERVAAAVARAQAPFWNGDSGCGEPFFANPQTGVFYPPAWLAALLPGRQAVGVEAALHLALLGAGCALLALELGASSRLAVAAGWGVALSGPAVSAVGVLNNLDTLAWAPFLWRSAIAGSTGGVAVFLALAWLGGEPQLALLAAAVALAVSPRRRTAVGAALGTGLVAVQLVPFAFWAAGGDRGVGNEVAEVVAGAVDVRELPALLVPAVPLPERADRFVGALALPAWGLLLAAWALLERRSPGRRLALCGWGLVGAAVLAGVLGAAWTAATLGLVRYPGRLLFLAAAALVPAAAAVASKGRGAAWIGALGGGAVLAVGLAVGAAWLPALAQGAAAGAVLVGGAAGGAAALAAAAALAVNHVPTLALERRLTNPVPACLIAQRAPGRVYVVQPSAGQVAAVARGGEQRAFDLGWGYTALLDGRAMARTFAPLRARPLAAHLAEADRGPAGRWWLDALAASRLVAQHPVSGFAEVCRDGDVRVFANSAAWPEASVVAALPRPGERPRVRGEVLAGGGAGDARLWRVEVEAGGGVLQWLATPDPGWRFTVDGRAVAPLRGAGILQGVPVPAGEHRVAARYRPPGLAAGAVVSLACALALLGVAWRRS
jgi:hypothetical protein